MAGYFGRGRPITGINTYTKTQSDDRFRDSISGDMLPDSDDTRDLGSSSKAWAEAYVGGLYLPEQASAPSTNANEGAVYTKESGGQSELFYRGESDGDEVQITKGGNVKSVILQFGKSNDGTTYSTTSTTAFSANGSLFTVTPTKANTSLLCYVTCRVFSSDNGSGTGGVQAVPQYYNGSTYVGTNALPSVLFFSGSGMTFSSNQGTTAFSFTLNSTQVRSDTGIWYIRVKFSQFSSGATAEIRTGDMMFIEVDE